MDLCGWGDKGQDLTSAQEIASSGQFVRQWMLRTMAREAVLEEIANSSLRRVSAFDKSFTCADVKIGDTVLVYKAQSKKNALRRRGPAMIMDVDDTGVTMKFQS